MRFLTPTLLAMTAWPLMAFAVFAVFAPGEADAAASCFATCIAPTCRVDQELTLVAGAVGRVDDCEKRQLNDGTVMLSFRSRGKTGHVTARGKTTLGSALAEYMPIDCFVSDPLSNCPAHAGVQLPKVMGHRFESSMPWSPVGDSCALDLPCGTVSLDAGPWRARFRGEDARGRLRVMTTRGHAMEITVEAKADQVELPAGWLRPGQTYRYQWISSDGELVAAAEFSTLSTAAQREVDAHLIEARSAPVERRMTRIVDSLLADGLDWDALQWTLGTRGTP